MEDQNTGTQAPPPTPPAGEQKFTQADLERIIGERVARAKSSAQAEILQAVGVESVDALKARLTPAPPQPNEALTRLESELKALQAQLAERDAQVAKVTAQRLAEERDSQVLQAAKAANASDSEAVLALMARAGTLDAVVVEGKVDAGKVKEVLDALKASKPHLFAPDRSNYKGLPSNAGKPNPRPDEDAQKKAQDNLQRMIMTGKFKP